MHVRQTNRFHFERGYQGARRATSVAWTGVTGSAASIIPRLAGVAIPQCLTWAEYDAGEEAQILSPGIEVELARRGQERMAMQDLEALPARAGQLFKTLR